MNRVFAFSVIGLGALLAVGACNSDEATATEDHTPVRMLLIVGTDTMTTDTLFLPAGGNVTVRGSFYTAADDNLDDHEGEHWSRLTFNPGTLATAAVDSAHHYSHEVTVQGAAGSTGTVEVGYGHDVLADEHTLSAPVKIIP
ncbi:MAG TPA: hypothetical protein VLD58_06180 [Gemmatimonadales bacterium]|nr:hypothetical protein [Gemmatimonadales bacterium]